MLLTPYQKDIFQELVNIGVGRAASVLNKMVNSHIELHAPDIQLLDTDRFLQDFLTTKMETVSAIKLSFECAFPGTAALVFSPEIASNLITLLIDEQPLSDDFDMLRIGALEELGNIVLNSVIGTFSNILGEDINFITPEYYQDTFENLVISSSNVQGMVLLVRAHFRCEDRSIYGDIIIFFSLVSLEKLLESFDKLCENTQMQNT